MVPFVVQAGCPAASGHHLLCTVGVSSWIWHRDTKTISRVLMYPRLKIAYVVLTRTCLTIGVHRIYRLRACRGVWW